MNFQMVPIKNIVVKPDRGRKAFLRIEELSSSLKKNGFINPLCVTPTAGREGFYDLVAGERRYRAAILAGFKEVPITFKDSLSETEQKVIELEENTCREQLTWQEEAEINRQIHELKQSVDPEWTQQKTADLVNLSRNHVSLQISMAKKLNEDPTLKEKVKNLPINVAVKVLEQQEQVARMDRLTKAGKIEITTDLRLGSCLDLIKQLPAASVDCVVTDPPYGLEKLEALREGGNNRMPGHQLMSEHHNQDLDKVLELLRALAPELVRVLKPGAHFYCFTAMQYLGDFIKALAPLEFQPPALIWVRNKTTTIAYGYNYMSRAETIIYGYNPPRTKRLTKNMSNILEHDDVPANLRVYPTEKPLSLLKDLIQQSTMSGDTVLDLFAGSASTLKAARALGRKSIGFEINPDSWKRAQLYLSGQIDSEDTTLFPDDSPEVRAATAKIGIHKGAK